MNREIKFRAWSPNGKCEGRCLEEIIDRGFGLPVTSNETKIMQYTGLKDKNGKEIYERDILKHGEGFGDGIGIVSYVAPLFALEYKNTYCKEFDFERCEIIGNIYENPNLTRK